MVAILFPSAYNYHFRYIWFFWVVTLKLDGRLLPFISTMWCDDKLRMCDDKSRTKSFCRRPFIIMHVILFAISFHEWWIIFISWSGSPQVQPTMCICIPKANYLHAHLQGEPLQLMKTISYPYNFTYLSLLKTSTNLSSITKKGEILSASSATPSWFWSIDDKPIWGTNVFVRIVG